MRVFYTASFYGKRKYQKYYDLVLKAIEKTGVELISPEKGNYFKVLTEKDYKDIKSKKKLHYEAIKRGITWAQAVIIEISNEDFQLGHEATLATQAKKPVLCLSLNEDFSEKINNSFFYAAKYNEYNIEEIVDDFIKNAEKEALNQRFNLFVSPRQLTYLENAAKRSEMNMSEYLRMLVDKDQK